MPITILNGGYSGGDLNNTKDLSSISHKARLDLLALDRLVITNDVAFSIVSKVLV